jgi:hypothetical protein
MQLTQKRLFFSRLKPLVTLPLLFLLILTGCLNPTSKPVTHIFVDNGTDYLVLFYLDRQDTVNIYPHKNCQFDVAPGQYVASALIVQGVYGVPWGPETLYVAPGETDTLGWY